MKIKHNSVSYFDMQFVTSSISTTLVLLLLGLATRYSALALLVMTLVIEVFVYPEAYPTHGVWAAVLLYLIARGPGVISVDHLLAARMARR